MAKKTKVLKEKKSEAAAVDTVAAGAGGEPSGMSTSKKKKKMKAMAKAEDAEPVVAEDEAPKKRKKQKLVVGEDEAGGPSAAQDGEAPKKNKKQKLLAGDDEVAEPSAAKDGDQAEPKDEASAGCLTVFVGGVPWACGEDMLRKDFSECGEVSHVKLVTDPDTGKSRGIAFITFKDEAGVKGALAYDGTDYGGRFLKVNLAPDRNTKGEGKGGKGKSRETEVFVKGMDRMTTEKKVRKFFKDCGELERLAMPLNPEGQCKGFAWLTFTTKEAVAKAVELNGSELKGSNILVEQAGMHLKGESKGKGKGKAKGDPELEVFVKNMPFEIDEETLRRDFAECGEIASMKFPMKDKEKCMGFAWINFKTKEAVDKALEFHGTDYANRKLVVERCVDKVKLHGPRQ